MHAKLGRGTPRQVESDKTRALDSAEFCTVWSRQRQQTQSKSRHTVHQQQSLQHLQYRYYPHTTSPPTRVQEHTTVATCPTDNALTYITSTPRLPLSWQLPPSNARPKHVLLLLYIVSTAVALHSEHGPVADNLDGWGARVWAKLLCHHPAGLPRPPFEHLSGAQETQARKGETGISRGVRLIEVVLQVFR